MSVCIYCWTCERHAQQMNSESEAITCPQCGDTFVEIEENTTNGQFSAQTMGEESGDWQANLLNMLRSAFGGGNLEAIANDIMDAINVGGANQNPASESIRRSLPELKVRAADAQGEPSQDEACIRAFESCPVCHEEFVVAEKVTEMPCSHCFHRPCLMRWLEKQNTCPLCRLELPNS